MAVTTIQAVNFNNQILEHAELQYGRTALKKLIHKGGFATYENVNVQELYRQQDDMVLIITPQWVIDAYMQVEEEHLIT